MGKMNTYKIIDRVGNHDTAIIEAANGRAALKKFLASHMMSTGIYECIKDGDNWHMVSSYGSDFEAVPMKEDA